jgi:hypothetical protein
MTLSFAEIDSQHVELLPPRTVMSTFAMWNTDGGGGGDTITVDHNHLCGVSIGQVGVGVGVLGIGLGNFLGATSC